MRVILQVTSESHAGHRFLLGSNQSLEAGRSELLDISFQHDPMMSGRHFRVWTEDGSCYLEDLQSTNGTFINGQRIMRALLRDGDTILAGTTSLTIRIEGARADPKAAITGTITYPDPAILDAIHYSVETYKSGVICYQGTIARMPPATFIASLRQRFSYLLIVSPIWAPPVEDEQSAGVVPLLGWLPESARPSTSPMLVIGAELLEQFPAIDSAWRQDGLVAVFWDPNDEAPCEQLQRGAGTFARPSLLRPQLQAAPPEYVERLLTSISAILVPGDDAETWNLLSLQDLAPQLKEIGLVAKPNLPAPSPQPQHPSAPSTHSHPFPR